MFLGFHSRIPHAKNQLPTTKTVTCRADTDRQTNKQTNKQTEIVNTEGRIEIFWSFFSLISLLISRPKMGQLRIKGIK